MKFNLKSYNKKGYFIVKNILSKKFMNELVDVIKLNYLTLAKKKRVSSLHLSLLNLRLKNKKKFSILFDTIQTVITNYKILSDKKIINLCSKVLKNCRGSVSLTDVSLRLDPPNDSRNSLEWHQDSSYFMQNINPKNGLVLWAPVIDLEKNMGGLEFLEESYKIGTQYIKKRGGDKKGASAQRSISLKKINNFKKIVCNELRVGDVIIMNMDLVHRSGINVSNKFRISLIGRYHNTISGDFNSGLNVYKYTDAKLNNKIQNGY